MVVSKHLSLVDLLLSHPSFFLSVFLSISLPPLFLLSCLPVDAHALLVFSIFRMHFFPSRPADSFFVSVKARRVKVVFTRRKEKKKEEEEAGEPP